MTAHRFVLVLFVGALVSIGALGNAGAEPLTPAAVWAMPRDFMEHFHARCDAHGGQEFADCFVAAMQQNDASPEAITFARRMGGEAYLRRLDPMGKIAVAYAVFPFRANENEAWFLVNGTPDMVAVDDLTTLPVGAIQASAGYRAMRSHAAGEVTLWPGDRNVIAQPGFIGTAGGSETFLVTYRLRDGCHACALLGFAKFEFAFDRDGNFRGARFISVFPVTPPDKKPSISTP